MTKCDYTNYLKNNCDTCKFNDRDLDIAPCATCVVPTRTSNWVKKEVSEVEELVQSLYELKRAGKSIREQATYILKNYVSRNKLLETIDSKIGKYSTPMKLSISVNDLKRFIGEQTK